MARKPARLDRKKLRRDTIVIAVILVVGSVFFWINNAPDAPWPIQVRQIAIIAGLNIVGGLFGALILQGLWRLQSRAQEQLRREAEEKRKPPL